MTAPWHFDPPCRQSGGHAPAIAAKFLIELV
jgi:hypothetical protein